MSKYQVIVNKILVGEVVRLSAVDILTEEFSMQALRMQVYRELSKVDRLNMALTGQVQPKRLLKWEKDINSGDLLVSLKTASDKVLTDEAIKRLMESTEDTYIPEQDDVEESEEESEYVEDASEEDENETEDEDIEDEDDWDLIIENEEGDIEELYDGERDSQDSEFPRR